MATTIPGLPPVPASVTDPAVRQWMQAFAEAVAIRAGQQGDPLDRAVTVRELGDGGVAQVQAAGKQAVVTALPSGDLSTDQTLPVTPVNFEAHANPRSVVLTWSKHQQLNIAHAEVYRSASDVLEDAVLVGVSPGQSYADTDIAAGQTWFYWLRYMSFAQNPGAWYSLTPVEVTVPELSGDEIVDLDVDKLVGNTAAFVEANIGEASITNAMIGNEIKSDNFVPGERGWRVDKSGNAEFNSLRASGDILGAYIRGSIIEGSLFIKESNDILVATEADQGAGTIRYMAIPQKVPNTVIDSRPNNTSGDDIVTSHEVVLYTYMASAGYEAEGSVFSDATQQDVFVNFNRYRYYKVKPLINLQLRNMYSAHLKVSITIYGTHSSGRTLLFSHDYFHAGAEYYATAQNKNITYGHLRTVTEYYKKGEGRYHREVYAWINFDGIEVDYNSSMFNSLDVSVRFTSASSSGTRFYKNKVAYLHITDQADVGF